VSQTVSPSLTSTMLEDLMLDARIKRLRVITPVGALLVLAGFVSQAPTTYHTLPPLLFWSQFVINICYLILLGVSWHDAGQRRMERATTLCVAGGMVFNFALSVTGIAYGTLAFGAPTYALMTIVAVVLSPHPRAWLWGIAGGVIHVLTMIVKGALDPTILPDGDWGVHLGASVFLGLIIFCTSWFATRLVSDLNLALDATEHARRDQETLNAELEQARALAQQASEAKTAFIAETSHELRTPLNAIIGYVELIHEEMEDGEDSLSAVSPDLAHISEAAHHLLGLISNILDLSKIEAGKMEVFVEPITLSAMLDSIRSTAQPLAKKRGNQLVIEDLAEGVPFHSDRIKLQQSLLNLLSNAAKFTQDGTITLRLSEHREAEDARRWLKMEVSDTGQGIPTDKLGALFQAFSQVDGAQTTRHHGGTGLGLMISQHFCKMLGGSISVTSEVGVGTTFTIVSPEQASAKS
jgi:signal transduction histidine kinase